MENVILTIIIFAIVANVGVGIMWLLENRKNKKQTIGDVKS